MLIQKIIILSIVLLISSFTRAHNNANHADDTAIMVKAVAAMNDGDLDTARNYIYIYEQEHIETSSARAIELYQNIKYQILNIELHQSEQVHPQKLEDFARAHKAINERYADRLTELYARQDESFFQVYSSWISNTGQYITTMDNLGLYAEAFQALDAIQRKHNTYADILSKPIDKTTLNPLTGQRQTITTNAFHEHSIPDFEFLRLKQIELARKFHHSSGTQQSLDVLRNSYQQYVDEFPTRPKAGLFLNLAMELDGFIDLDKLIEIYKKCQDKDNYQYNGNILGISNLLIDAERFEDALFFLEQVQPDYLPIERIPELHYGLARAHYALSNYKLSLDYLLKVRSQTDRYQGVDYYIKDILGDIDKVADNELVRLISGAAIAQPSQEQNDYSPKNVATDISVIAESNSVDANGQRRNEISEQVDDELQNRPQANDAGIKWLATLFAIVIFTAGVSTIMLKSGKGPGNDY